MIAPSCSSQKSNPKNPPTKNHTQEVVGQLAGGADAALAVRAGQLVKLVGNDADAGGGDKVPSPANVKLDLNQERAVSLSRDLDRADVGAVALVEETAGPPEAGEVAVEDELPGALVVGLEEPDAPGRSLGLHGDRGAVLRDDEGELWARDVVVDGVGEGAEVVDHPADGGGEGVLRIGHVVEEGLAGVLLEPELGAGGDEELVGHGVDGKDGHVPEPEAVKVDKGVLDGRELGKDGAVEAAGDIHGGVVLEGDGPAAVGLVDLVEVRLHVEDVDDHGGAGHDPGVDSGGKPRDPNKEEGLEGRVTTEGEAATHHPLLEPPARRKVLGAGTFPMVGINS